MKREILISGTQREIRVAILEDDQLVELQVDRPEARRMVGDIYLGKVEAVLPGLQAAFVDIGTEKSAFLHSSDLVFDEGDDDDDDEDGDDEDTGAADETTQSAADSAEEVAADTGGDSPYADVPAPAAADAKVELKPEKKAELKSEKGDQKGGDGRQPQGGRGRRGGGRRPRRAEPPQIQDVLKRGQTIICQVSKEPISTKGPRVTAQVSLAGRFLVFMPFASRVGVSRKIGERAERQRLREQVQKMLPKDSGGVIVRTVGEDVTPDTFNRELSTLMTQWAKIHKKQKFVGSAPKLLHRETSLTRGIIRDLFSAKVDKLTVDSKQIHNEIVEYLQGIAPELIDRVVLHEEKTPLFDKAEIETEIRDLFKRRCDLPSGGYLIIEPTEALVSVDVNSGRYTGKKDPEKTSLRTNVEAAREVARQLRLRDIGGIIVCDFIDMETRGSRDKVLQELRTHLGRDRARTKAFAVSDLGLIELTRQRVRQSHLQNMTMPCPTCHGTGRVFTPETIVRRMERSIRRMAVDGKKDNMIVKLHPETALYVLENEKDLMQKLEKGLGFRLEMRDDPLLEPDEFKLVVKGAGRDVTQQYAVA
ncbi:MAG: Rne/Rng family ribonuclease [Gemmatimonadetes bacterium]|nr:Rne/Rng family ribonuclease [Gemmatimonadota bacterium]